MVLNLFLYVYVFKNTNTEKLKKSVLISTSIYIVSIYIAIITNTSSPTYIEQMGYKGWFESGNSLCAILTLSMFVYLSLTKEKKYLIWVAMITLMVGIFLTLLVGTRVGVYGYLLVLGVYILAEVVQSFIRNEKIDKKLVIVASIIIIGIIAIILIFGSSTIQRRKYLKSIEADIIDESVNSQSHITGDLLEIKEKIDGDTLEDGYMNEAEKQSIVELYNIANKWNIKNNDQRMQQLIYNAVLVKNQKNIWLKIFGNGYMANHRELVCEMEVPAILFNFGILGFVLYLGPFIVITLYGVYKKIKYREAINADFMRYVLGCGFAFALSIFSGYTFFSQSTMVIVIVLNCLVLNYIENDKNT